MSNGNHLHVHGYSRAVSLVGALVTNPYWGLLDTPDRLVGQCGVCTMPCAPLRAQPSDGAELEGQLLFGEPFEVLATSGEWLKVQRLLRHPDCATWGSMSGWIDSHLVPACIVSREQADRVRLETDRAIVACHTIRAVPCNALPGAGATTGGTTLGGLTLPFGSVLSRFNPRDRSFSVLQPTGQSAIETRYALVGDGRVVVGVAPASVELLLDLLAEFDGVQYLWGGQTTWGVDCSGLIQTILRVFGAEIPRNASEQAHFGAPIELADARTGDLLFFARPEQMDRHPHVGFLVRGESGELALYHSKQRVKCQLLAQEATDIRALIFPEARGVVGSRIRRVVSF